MWKEDTYKDMHAMDKGNQNKWDGAVENPS